MTNSGPMLVIPPPGGQKEKRPKTRPPLPEQKLFLGGVTDAIGDAVGSATDWVGQAATDVGDFVKENPATIGTVLGAAAAPFTGGASLGGAAGTAASKITGDATGAGLKRKRRRQKIQTQRATQKALASPLPNMVGQRRGSGVSTGDGQTSIIAHGGYIHEEMAQGGKVPIGQDAEKIVGPRHKNGGVQLNKRTEVEGGETMDNVKGSEYVFSDRLTVPREVLPDGKRGMTFAEYHEQLVKNDAPQSQIQELAEIQERVSGRKDSGSGREVGANKGQDQPNQKIKHLGPMGKRLKQMGQMARQNRQNGGLNIVENEKAYGGKRKMEEGGYYAVKASETEGDEPKYPINSADDVKDAWKLRNHGDYNISQSTLEERIKRKAREYDVDLSDDKAMGGYTDDDRRRYDYAYGGEKKYQDGGFFSEGLNLDFGMDSYSELPESSGGVDGFGSVLGTGNMDFGIDSYSKMPQGPVESQNQGFLSQAGDFAQSALPYLPAAINVGRGLFEDSEVPDVPYTPPAGRAEETIGQMETDVNVDPQLASVDRSLRSIIADPTASQNQKRAAATNAMKQRAKIEAREENKETGLQNEMLTRLASAQQQRDQAISSGRTQAAQAERRQQMKADARQNQMIQKGLQQASQRFQQQQRWEDKLDMDAMSLASQLATVPDEGVRNYVLGMLRDRFPAKANEVERIMLN